MFEAVLLGPGSARSRARPLASRIAGGDLRPLLVLYPGHPGACRKGFTPQGYKVGHLLGIHSIAFPHLGWRNPSHFSGAHGIENCGPVRGELKRVTVATGDYGRPTAPLFLGDGGCQEVVGLIARGLSVGEPAGAHEDWQ